MDNVMTKQLRMRLLLPLVQYVTTTARLNELTATTRGNNSNNNWKAAAAEHQHQQQKKNSTTTQDK
eukprot:scaffold604229_cov24-Prasinocladus_malaysianus.AAC.1